MLRKVMLGLLAAASLSVAAIAPASAHGFGFHGGGWGHGWGHGHGFGGLYINTGVSDCYRQQMVQTRYGLRLRTVNVCAYDVY
jgi:Spy/CpxP family protein refolding chaperone